MLKSKGWDLCSFIKNDDDVKYINMSSTTNILGSFKEITYILDFYPDKSYGNTLV